jgi:hypothetical protein
MTGIDEERPDKLKDEACLQLYYYVASLFKTLLTASLEF